MCGINGIFAYHHAANPVDRAELLRTREHMARRGPDGMGDWLSADGRVGLGHRRLAIIDISESGAQPMSLGNSDLVVTFNGEIYNYRQLRRDLEAQGRVFTSNSDTEVLLHLFAVKGEEMVHDLRGMFAFALWDAAHRRLFLARDPYGIKPLYTSDDGWTFRFASQVKALLAGGRVSRDPDPAGAVGFMLWGSVPEPFTLYQEIRSLPAGHCQFVDDRGPQPPKAYASLARVFAEGARNPCRPDAVVPLLKEALADSVAAHLVADVDVGLFLSGGVDSTSLLAAMHHLGRADVCAVTLHFSEFDGTEEDEAPLSADAARRLGARHVVRTVGQKEFAADLPQILEAMDQPSIDGINSWFIAKAAREQGLKVAMSGVGGDEILAGYPSFTDIPRWVRLLAVPSRVPGLGRLWRKSVEALGIGRHRPKLAALAEFGGDYASAYLLRRGLFMPSELGGLLDRGIIETGLRRLDPVNRVKQTLTPSPANPLSRVGALESGNYLRNQLLRDIDWASMAHSLEVRTPFVDFRFLQHMAPLVPHCAAGRGKQALTSASGSDVSTATAGRRKTGFNVPLARWLGKPGTEVDESKGFTSRLLSLQLLDVFGIGAQ